MGGRLSLLIATLAFAVPVTAAQGAQNPPNSDASCTGFVNNFSSQFGSGKGHVQAELAKELRPLGQAISDTSQTHLASYEACIGG